MRTNDEKAIGHEAPLSRDDAVEDGERDRLVRSRRRPAEYAFSADTMSAPGARDLSRSNTRTADRRVEISRFLRFPTVLRTEVRAPFAHATTALIRYPADELAALEAAHETVVGICRTIRSARRRTKRPGRSRSPFLPASTRRTVRRRLFQVICLPSRLGFSRFIISRRRRPIHRNGNGTETGCRAIHPARVQESSQKTISSVPEGQLRVAQRFNSTLGGEFRIAPVPKGRLNERHVLRELLFPSRVQHERTPADERYLCE